MSLLLRLGRRLEAIVEGAFSRRARDRVHPLDIGRRLLRDMDHGAVVGVGGVLLPNDYRMFLSSVEDSGRGKQDPSGAAPGAPVGDTRVYRRPGSKRLRIQAGPAGQRGHEFLLDQPVTTIGRRDDQDIVLDAPSVSRTHARVEIDREGAVIVDLGSTNGTLVNGRVLRRGRVALQHGDRIKIGAVLLEYLTGP